MLLLLIITLSSLLVSFFFDRAKTLSGIRRGITMFLNLLPVLLFMLAVISFVLYFIPEELLLRWMGAEVGIAGWLLAAFLGSVSLIPGFIAFPLCNVLLQQGAAYATIAVFITTLTMVGVVTLPLEAKYFGWKASIVRNIVSLLAALLVGLLMALFL